ncbi:unnamed protein product [Protopolystoma xenopodis]|uniref:Uncharacterized protein n=1 Tax=Protopolystoma xenopodis TaxID=117903 RepID=A0A3S5A1L2_9PLAT|nr:unnamed protein product [Protopolystoma xenopodis]
MGGMYRGLRQPERLEYNVIQPSSSAQPIPSSLSRPFSISTRFSLLDLTKDKEHSPIAARTSQAHTIFFRMGAFGL